MTKVNTKILVNLISFLICVSGLIAVLTVNRGNFIAPFVYVCLVYLPLSAIQGGFLLSIFINRKDINKAKRPNLIFPIIISLLAVGFLIYFLNTTS